MGRFIPILLVLSAGFGHWVLVSSRALPQSIEAESKYNELSCIDLPYAGTNLSKRIDFNIPHDDPAGVPHENPGSDPHGPSRGPDPVSPAGNPLSTAGDRNKILPYSDYQTRGSDASSSLDRAITQNLPDKAPGDHRGYAEKRFDDNLNGLSNIFSDPGVGLNMAGFTRVQLRTGDKSLATFDAGYNIPQRALVVHDMDKGEDSIPLGDPRRVATSDLMAQIYRDAGGSLRDLRVVIQDSVYNEGTLATITKIYQDSHVNLDRVIEWAASG